MFSGDATLMEMALKARVEDNEHFEDEGESQELTPETSDYKLEPAQWPMVQGEMVATQVEV